jgi:hypothetical protein
MSLAIPLYLFAGFLVSAILAVVFLIGSGAREAVLASKRPFSTYTPSWGLIISYFLGLLFVLLANIGWWGGWIALVVWAVLKLA